MGWLEKWIVEARGYSDYLRKTIQAYTAVSVLTVRERCFCVCFNLSWENSDFWAAPYAFDHFNIRRGLQCHSLRKQLFLPHSSPLKMFARSNIPGGEEQGEMGETPSPPLHIAPAFSSGVQIKMKFPICTFINWIMVNKINMPGVNHALFF